MAGEQSVQKSEGERHFDGMWKIGDISPSAMFTEEQKPTTACNSGWSVNPTGPICENLFQSSGSTDMAVLPPAAAAAASSSLHHHSHSSLIFGSSSSELGWSSMQHSQRGPPHHDRSAPGFSELMDIDVRFDSSYMTFTQCLQAGLQMDPSDYSALSRSLGIGWENHFPEYNTHANASSHDPQSSAAFDFPSPLAEAGEHMGDVPNVPTTPNSSTSSSSAEGNDEAATVASTSGAKEQAAAPQSTDQAPAAAADQDESQDKLSADSKKAIKPRKKGQKRNREPRFAFMTKSDVDHLEDGYRWRKYGQKAVKNSPYPRSYYRCTNSKCSVKKRVERSFEDPSIVITTYEGQHTHQSPSLLRGSAGGGAGAATAADHAHFADQRTSTTSSFTQSTFDFPLQMMVQVPPRTSAAFDNIQQQQDLHRQQQQTVVPSPHPALQRSQPHHQHQLAPNLTDHGLLEDIVPSGMRKLS